MVFQLSRKLTLSQVTVPLSPLSTLDFRSMDMFLKRPTNRFWFQSIGSLLSLRNFGFSSAVHLIVSNPFENSFLISLASGHRRLASGRRRGAVQAFSTSRVFLIFFSIMVNQAVDILPYPFSTFSL